MPEGDTIYRAANTLSRALVGRTVLAARAHDGRLRPAAIVGKKVVKVEARGKHLLMTFDDGAAIHSHMGMTGSWHIYKPGERWQMPDHLARLVLETDAYVAVCFRAPQIDRIEIAAGAEKDFRIERLGPDVLRDDFDAKEAARRLRALGGTLIGDALLDQKAIAGIGNIWRSETLFVARVHPETPISALDDAELERIAATAQDIMRRSTLGHDPLQAERARFVYERYRLPCLRCGEKIERRRIGVLQRNVYFCPRCQPFSREPLAAMPDE